MPLLGFGTWQVHGNAGYDAVRVALEAGYRHIDTATMYGNEAEVGRALRDSGVTAHEVFVTTKLPPEPGRPGARDAGREPRGAWASTLRPVADPLAAARAGPPRLWEQFIAARDEGLARAIGVSNYDRRDRRADPRRPARRRRSTRSAWGPVAVRPGGGRRPPPSGAWCWRVTARSRPRTCTTRCCDRRGGTASTPAQVIVRWHLQHEFVVIPKSVTTATGSSVTSRCWVHAEQGEMGEMDGMSRR